MSGRALPLRLKIRFPEVKGTSLYERKKTYAAFPAWAAAALPAAGNAGILVPDGVDRPRQPDRGDLYPIHFSPCRSLSAGMGHAVSLLAGGGLADPVCSVGDSAGSGAGLCPGGGQFLHPAAARRALPALGSDAGIRGCRCGSCGRYPHPDQHGGVHCYYCAAGCGVFLPL